MNRSRNPKTRPVNRSRTNVNSSLTNLVPYAKGQPNLTLKIHTSLAKYTTTVTTGLIARSTSIEAGLAGSFSTRFAAFDEYRIIKVLFEAYPCSSNNPGTLNMWCEPLNSGTPNATIAATNAVTSFSAGGNSKVTKLVYKPADFAFLDWITVGTTNSTVGYFNMYTDLANYASSAVVTDYVIVHVILTVQFRGFA